MKTHRPAQAASALLVLAAAAACGTSGGPEAAPTTSPAQPSPAQQPAGQEQGQAGADQRQPGKLPEPAEPGEAPEQRADLPGTITALPGGSPEGAVVDPKTGTLSVALRDPDRIALLEPNGRVREVAVSGAARHLSSAGPGQLLVPSEDRGTLLQVQLPEGRVTSSFPVGSQPHDAAPVPAGIAVTKEAGGEVALLRPDGQVTTAGGFAHPGGLTAVGDRIAAIDVRANTLHVLDAADLRTVAVLPAGRGPSHVRPIGGGRVAVADTRGHAVLTYQVTGAPRQLGTTALPGRAYGLATDPARGFVYTSAADRNEVVRLRVDEDGRLVDPRPVPTVAQPNSVAVGPSGTLFVVGQQPAQVQRLEPRNFAP